jgi:hypothetical protein
MKKYLVIFLIIVFSGHPAYSGWDDFKKKAGNAIERSKEAGRKTRDFGKRTKKSWDDGSERRKKVYDNARKKTREAGRTTRDFGKKTKKSWDDGADRRKQMYDNARKNTRETVERTRDFGKRAKKSWDDDTERRKKIYSSVKKNYNNSVDRIRDPETRRQAKEMINKGLELRRKWKDTKRRGVENSVDAIAMIPVGGGMTLGAMMVKQIGNKYPGLENAGLLDRDTAVAFGLGDKTFFAQEIEFIDAGGGRKVSLIGAISETSPLDADRTMKCLAVMGAVEGLTSADDVDGAVGALLNTMDAVNE